MINNSEPSWDWWKVMEVCPDAPTERCRFIPSTRLPFYIMAGKPETKYPNERVRHNAMCIFDASPPRVILRSSLTPRDWKRTVKECCRVWYAWKENDWKHCPLCSRSVAVGSMRAHLNDCQDHVWNGIVFGDLNDIDILKPGGSFRLRRRKAVKS